MFKTSVQSVKKMPAKTVLVKLTLFLVVVYYVECKTSFVKDQSMDFVFPPLNIRKVNLDIPDGHLRPLGWQRRPDGKVREEKEVIDPATFYLRYVKTAKPMVMREVLKKAPVVVAWEDDANLKKKYGLVNITITVKREVLGTQTKRHMLFRKFILDYMYENWYLSCTVPEEMMGELPLPEVLSCGTFKERLIETELWMSSGGTTSSLHSHNDHNIHCLLDGRKDFILIEGKHKDAFGYQETYPNSGAGSSPLDMEMINMYKYKKIGKIPWIWSTLYQGDCLFLPAGYLHQVRAYGRGISYTVQFAPSVTFNSTDCEKDAPKKPEEKKKRRRKTRKGKKGEKDKAKEEIETKDAKPEEKKDEKPEEKKHLTLADVKFVWAYVKGERQLSDTNLEPASLRRLLFLILKEGEQLYIEQFQHFYNESLYMDKEKPEPEEVFNILAPEEGRTFITREEISSLSKSRLEHVCEIFNRRHKRVHDEL